MLPDWFELWDFGDPLASEKTFLELLPNYGLAGLDKECELRTQIARALGLQGNFGRASAELDTVEANLDALSPRTRIYYLLERGRCLNSGGDPEASRRYFLDAVAEAEHSGEEDLLVDALHMMGIVDKGQEALEWNEKALAVAQSSTLPRARRWQASLFNNIGWTYHDLGQYEKALLMFQAAIPLREQMGAEEPLRMAKWAFFRCLRSLGRLQEALDGQLALARELSEKNGQDGFVEEEIAEIHLALGDETEARKHFKMAWEQLKGVGWLQKSDPQRLERLERLGKEPA